MHGRRCATTIAAFALVLCAHAARAADDATLLRVFLKDGTSLVSYGEPARAGDRVIFSMPTAATPNPPLQLVDLAVQRVDWERTERYANAARAARYVATQADSDYAMLSAEISQALADVAMTPEPQKRLAIVESARKRLADWPQTHYNFRVAEVRQMLGMLDEAIADLRAASGIGRFDLALTAYVDPPTIAEPLLPDPTPREAIEQVLVAANTVDSAIERRTLLNAAAVSLERDKAVLPADWAAARRAEVGAEIQAEDQVDRSYSFLTKAMMTIATRRARMADVHGVERVVARVKERDAALGGKRPETVAALVAAVEQKLDAARRLRLARDRWALRAPAYHEYNLAIRRPVDLWAAIGPSLEDIKSLAGSTPAALRSIERAVAEIVTAASTIVPPAELAAAQALLVSAAQLAGNAARIRREATLAGDMTRAWDASSAAAGALMLGARARSEMQTILRPPQLR